MIIRPVHIGLLYLSLFVYFSSAFGSSLMDLGFSGLSRKGSDSHFTNQRKITKSYYKGKYVKQSDKLLESKCFSDKDFILTIGQIIIGMEVGPYEDYLNKEPNVLHALLQSDPDVMIKLNRDTSFGWYGFTSGTFGMVTKMLTKYKHDDPIVEGIQKTSLLLDQDNKKHSRNVPIEQVYGLLGYISYYVNSRSKTKVVNKSLDDLYNAALNEASELLKKNENFSKFAHGLATGTKHSSNYDVAVVEVFKIVALFYQTYNGIPQNKDQKLSFSDKIIRLGRVVDSVFNKR